MTNEELARRFPLLAAGGQQKCRVCGCTQDNACTDAEIGNCWWIEADLCSHCGEPEIVLLQARRLFAGDTRLPPRQELLLGWTHRAMAALQHASTVPPEAFEV